ncbi:MAG TPA: SH3 domain-containing protein, partial [Sedimentisphaerales bacterium]|nr:SH3 domain-containing protein [Sedimentisphaerales bacterium]
MRSYMNLFIFAILTCLVSIGFAQQSGTAPGSSQAVDTSSFPYSAVITGDDVYVRSGPGTNFYHCGKLKTGDKVKVVGKQFSWSRIVPPAGSFSWISMQYVTINPTDPKVGTVTGDNVRVYAGSDYVKPLYSTTLQGKLSKGEKVKLLGEQMDDYYKIAAPPFAYLWVSTNFTKAVPEPVKIPPVAPTPTPTPVEAKVEPNEPADANATVVVVPEPVAPKSPLEKYRELQEQVKTEHAKPADQQDYTDLKKALLEIANNEEAGNAARFSQFVVGQIESYELALAVVKEVKLQNEQLEKVKAGIDKAKETRLAEVETMGKFAIVGEFQTYQTYGPGHYRIVDEAGKMICYALPAGTASQMDLNGFVG